MKLRLKRRPQIEIRLLRYDHEAEPRAAVLVVDGDILAIAYLNTGIIHAAPNVRVEWRAVKGALGLGMKP